MPIRRRAPEPDPEEPLLDTGRSWSTRLAWATLVGGGLFLVTRLSVATVVAIHGDGMAPTLVDGDHVLLMRGTVAIESGDVVVYEPVVPGGEDPSAPEPPVDAPEARNADGDNFPDARQEPAGDFRNVAVIDPDELQENWQKVQRKSDGIMAHQAAPLRLGRVIAAPGDRVAFHVPGAALGLAVNGNPLSRKVGDPIRVVLVDGESADGSASLRPTAWESTDERRWQVLAPDHPGAPTWTVLHLPPPGAGPVEVEAPGYLVVADNRDDGACCDSRALGWIPEDAIRGRVLVRLAGAASKAEDATPRPGVQWSP